MLNKTAPESYNERKLRRNDSYTLDLLRIESDFGSIPLQFFNLLMKLCKTAPENYKERNLQQNGSHRHTEDRIVIIRNNSHRSAQGR